MKIEIMGSKKLLWGSGIQTMNLGHTPHSTSHPTTTDQILIVRIWAMAREILQQREKGDSCLALLVTASRPRLPVAWPDPHSSGVGGNISGNVEKIRVLSE
jgi:hypothetical protein